MFRARLVALEIGGHVGFDFSGLVPDALKGRGSAQQLGSPVGAVRGRRVSGRSGTVEALHGLMGDQQKSGKRTLTHSICASDKDL